MSRDPNGADSAPEPRNIVEQSFSTLVAGLNGVGAVWIFALMVFINLDVLSRSVLNLPIGAVEVVELSIVGIVFLQISDAIRAGRLTRSDGLFSRLLQRRPILGHTMGVIFDLAGTCFFVFILLGAVPRLAEAYERGDLAGDEGVFVFPLWPVRLILVVGCVAAALQFVLLAVRHIKALQTVADNGE